VCTFCIMDESDPEISFDAAGRCNRCVAAAAKRPAWMALPVDRNPAFDETIRGLRRRRSRSGFDVMIGLSGGLDSSYALICAAEAGLKVLAMHCDTGWNSRQSVANIESLCKRFSVPLETTVIDWDAMRDAQRAFFRSGVPNCDIPQDHAIAATVNRAAAKFGIRSFLSGGNWAGESILPIAWGHDAQDHVHLSAIWRQFGDWSKASRFPRQGLFQKRIWQPYVRGVTAWRVLNDLRFNPLEAERRLREEFCWQDYGGKHCESVFTRVFQSIYLPLRFRIDKRRAHLSSLIVSGWMTRDDAIRHAAQPPMSKEEAERDVAYLCEKLRITATEWRDLVDSPPRTHDSYPVGHLERWLSKFAQRYIEPRTRLRRNW
jgi:hypothetical protein